MEESTQQSNEPVENPPAETSLEQIYKEAGIEEQAQQFRQSQPQPQVAPQYQPAQTPNVPDPYDTDAFKAYLAQQQQGTTALQQSLQAIGAQLTKFQMERAQQTLEADIKKAVEIVNEEVGLNKPKMIEAYLDAMAREDRNFKALWDNRNRNPQAWEKALKVVSKKMGEEFSVKVDPALQEAQRARKLSQQAQATTKHESPDDSWDGLSQSEFESRWNRMVSGS